MAGPKHHERVDILASDFVWHPDHRHALDCGDLNDRVLDFLRVDVVATRDDDVLDAVTNVDFSKLVDDADVA